MRVMLHFTFIVATQVCVAVGACVASDFQFQTKATLRIQEQWDDKCFTCQAFAKELEVPITAFEARRLICSLCN